MRSLRSVFAAAVCAAIALSSCGSESAAPTTVQAMTTAAGPRVVSIGVITPQEGGLTDFGLGMLRSVELAVAEANAANAVPGWTIEVKAFDDSSDPEKGKAAAAAAIADGSVVAIVGSYNSGVAAAMLPALSEAGLALVSPSNTLTSLTLGADLTTPARQFTNYFRMVGADDKQGVFLAEQAIKAGFKTAAIVSETKAVSKGLADIFAASFVAKGGKVVVTEVVADGATDFASFVAKATAAKPDLVFFGGEYPVAATLRTQALAAGLIVPVMGGDGIKDDALIGAAGEAAEGVLASTVGVPLEEFESAKAFLAAYAAAGFTEPSSAYGPYAYDAANAIIRVLPALLGDSMPDDIRVNLTKALMTVTFDGSSGKVAFDQYGDTLYPVFTLYEVKNGLWVPAR